MLMLWAGLFRKTGFKMVSYHIWHVEPIYNCYAIIPVPPVQKHRAVPVPNTYTTMTTGGLDKVRQKRGVLNQSPVH